jgi:hypothetical protein
MMFGDLVHNVCTRPNMYVINGSFLEICAYIEGYALGAIDCPIGSGIGQNSKRHAFQEFVAFHLDTDACIVWTAAIWRSCTDDTTALKRLEEVIKAYLSELDMRSPEEICALYRRNSEERSIERREQEPQPEKTLRKFMIALVRGGEDAVRALILPNPEAAVLWAESRSGGSAVSAEVTRDLMAIDRIRVEAGDREGIVLRCPIFDGDILVVNTIDGWRVDADPVIKKMLNERPGQR